MYFLLALTYKVPFVHLECVYDDTNPVISHVYSVCFNMKTGLTYILGNSLTVPRILKGRANTFSKFKFSAKTGQLS